MATPTLAQFIALNDQLVALIKAGVPIHLGLVQGGHGAVGAIETIGATVARRIGEGSSVVEALEDRTIPPAYRSVAQLALRSGDLTTALTGAHRMAAALDDSWHTVRQSLVYPLVICCLAFAGIVLFCSFLVPTLDSMYQSMRIPEGSGLHVVKTLKSTLPYWIAIPPIGLLLLVGWTRFSSSPTFASGLAGRVLAWLPGMSKTVFEHRCMNFSETLASLLDAGVSLPEGLRLAASAWDDATLEQGTRTLAASLERGEVPDDSSPFAAQLPPFLRWAIWHADDTVGRSRALRMASNTYRQSARRRIERLRVVVPNLACIVIGGVVTLLYGLALFVPVAQMIRELAS